MPITINGSGTVTGISAGGLPDGVITTDDIAANAVTPAKLATTVVGPAFRAVNTGSQSVSANVFTKVAFQSEIFDTANCFDSGSSYRFTPNVAGYYFVVASLNLTLGGYTNAFANCAIYRNGSSFKEMTSQPTNGNYSGVTSTLLVYMNGTTDYLEVYTISNQSISVIANNAYSASFEACLIRPA